VVPPVGPDGTDRSVGEHRRARQDHLGAVAGGLLGWHRRPPVEQLGQLVPRRVGPPDERGDGVAEVVHQPKVHPRTGKSAVGDEVVTELGGVAAGDRPLEQPVDFGVVHSPSVCRFVFGL
jgi:hypothetical protein